MRKRNCQFIIRILFIVICFFLSSFSGASLWYWNIGVGWSHGYFGYQTLFLVSLLYCLVYIAFGKTYNAFSIGKYRFADLSFSQVLSFGFTDIVLFVASFFWFHNLQRLRIRYFVFCFIFQSLIAILLIFVFNRWNIRFDGPKKITIVYGDESYRRLLDKMAHYGRRYELIAAIEENNRQVKDAILSAEDVYLYEVRRDIRSKLIRFCREIEKQVHVSLDVDDVLLQGFSVSHYFDTPFFNSGIRETTWYYPFVKRFIDIVVSFTALVLLAPIMFITAVAVKMDDGGPVIYRQKRLTENRRLFTMYKFRSMKADSEKHAVLAMERDERITRVGKVIRFCRIDELPQLINILCGDMSLVGPRPERPEIARKYEKDFPDFSMRLKVKAGLTGYAQVYGKYNTTPEDKLKMDLLYITHRSVLMDLKIMFYTVKILFKAESTEGVSPKIRNG